MIKDFTHIQSCHCETGTVLNLLNYYGIKISEPMIFGIGSGLFFAHLPFFKPNGMPLTTFRVMPTQIRKAFAKKTGIKIVKKKYRNKKHAMDELDNLLEKNQPVGLLTNVFFLPYFPKSFRFHFNLHNMIVFAKEGNNYLVCDPVLENTTQISSEDLLKARFSHGEGITLKGNMFYLTEVPEKLPDLTIPVISGIKATSRKMTRGIVPFDGTNGMHLLSKLILKKYCKFEDKKAKRYMGHIIRMMEEVGTGGAGFRYIFASFLQESARFLKNADLEEISKEITKTGNRWREFSYNIAVLCKTEKLSTVLFENVCEILNDCAEKEQRIFKKLNSFKF